MSILIVEDSPVRLEWLTHRMPTARVATNPAAAIRAIRHSVPDVCFLDFELERGSNSLGVAAVLSETDARVIIHSANPEGAKLLKEFLPRAEVHPFATFEVDCNARVVWEFWRAGNERSYHAEPGVVELGEIG